MPEPESPRQIEGDLSELRRHRESRRGRDAIIGRLADSGVKLAVIAAAAGVSVTRIREIVEA